MLNLRIIYKFLNLIGQLIAHYLKEIYVTKMCLNKEGVFITVDESLYCLANNEKIWLIGLYNTNSKYFPIEAVKEKTIDVIKKIILHHIGKGNKIISDGWPRYA